MNPLHQAYGTDNLTMLTDFYELTMANGFLQNGLGDQIAYFAMDGESYPDEKVVIFAVADAAKGVSGKRGPRKGSHHTAKDGE